MAMGGFIAEVRAEHRATMVALYRTGLTKQAVCAQLGIGKGALNTALRLAGAGK